MKFKTEIFQILVAISISTILFLLGTWIAYYYYEFGNQSFKEAITITVSFLGPITTILAALVAVILFNDWREVHNKTIDAQLCMRIYDFVDFANDELVVINGFIKDYNKVNTINEYKELLITHNRRLLNLHDLTVTKLSNLGYIIEENEYNTKYFPRIEQLMKNLDVYIYVYKMYLDGYSFTKDQVDSKLDGLMIDTRNQYRAFVVELKKYYYA